MDATLVKVLGHVKQIEEIVADLFGDDLGWREKDVLELLGIISYHLHCMTIKAGEPLPDDV
jgi:hypothetical protein